VVGSEDENEKLSKDKQNLSRLFPPPISNFFTSALASRVGYFLLNHC
jgi:hypothetical protein